jgi:hypothetical protein
VVGGLDLERHVLDPKTIAQHADQIVQHLFGRPPDRTHVATHGVEATGDAPQVQIVDGLHTWHSAHGCFDLAHVQVARG